MVLLLPLYMLFLGLLALIHSPEPPKLLLIEEPEKGVYPKRLEEVIRDHDLFPEKARRSMVEAVEEMQAAVGFYRHEVALDGANTNAEADYGGALETLAGLEHSNVALLRQALVALRRARIDDPFNTTVPKLITSVQKSLARG